jgi:hypothetical protein
MASNDSGKDKAKEERDKKRKATLSELAKATEFIDLDDWEPNGRRKHVYTIIDVPIKHEYGITPTTELSAIPGVNEQTPTSPTASLPAPINHEDGASSESPTTPNPKAQGPASPAAVPAAPVNHEDRNAPTTRTQTTPDPKQHTLSDPTTEETPRPMSNPAPTSISDKGSAPKTTNGAEKSATTKFKHATVVEIEDESGTITEHSTKEDAIVLDDDDDVVEATAAIPKTAPRSESGLLTPEGISSTSEPVAEPMDLDQAPAQSTPIENPHTSATTTPINATAPLPTTPAESSTQDRRGPNDRVTSAGYRDQLVSVMRQIAAKRAVGPATPKTPAAKVGADPSTTKKARQKRTVPVSSGHDLESSQGSSSRRGKAITAGKTVAAKQSKTVDQQEASGGGGDPQSSDPDSSDGDGEKGNESDGGLFVNDPRHSSDRDDDEDVDMEDETEEQRAKREEREFKELGQRFKKAERKIKKLRKACDGGEIDMVEEVKYMSIKKEYDIAVRKWKMIMEREKLHDMENNQREETANRPFEDHGELFHTFEDRHTSQPMQEESDEDDLVAAYDLEAQIKQAKAAETDRDVSADELTGNRQRPVSNQQPRKKRGDAPAKVKKKEKPANNRVQDKKAKIAKGGKKKKQPLPSLDNPLLNTESLWTGDVIRDAAGNAGLGALPAMKAGDRKSALMQLVHSLPEEHRRNAAADKNSILNAMSDFTHKRAVRTKEGGFYIRGVKSYLKPHQLLGTAFMRRRENDPIEPKGGICADQMGLGSECSCNPSV